MSDLDTEIRWQHLKRYTPARIALGRAGDSIPTREHLRFELALAEARDAVHTELDVARLEADLRSIGLNAVAVHSQVRDRAEYLQRPDLGRRLDGTSVDLLSKLETSPHIAVVIADGLSAEAVHMQAVPLLTAFKSEWKQPITAPVVIAQQARVALGDQVAQLLNAQGVVILIGERPGLSAPDSLGIYFTYQPRSGTTDADRNCISNVRAGGPPHHTAAQELKALIDAARVSGFSGVRLKQFTAEHLNESQIDPLQLEPAQLENDQH